MITEQDVTNEPLKEDNSQVTPDTNVGQNGEAGSPAGVSSNTGLFSSEGPPQEDKVRLDKDTQSYEHLRVKMNDQGIELNTLRRELEEAKSKAGSVEELTSKHREASEELAAYRKWYDEYYPVLNNLYQDEALRERIKSGVKPSAITEEEAEKIAERKIAEYKDQTRLERSIDGWVNKHPDVQGKLAQDIYNYLGKHDLNPTPEILEMAYVYCTKDKLKEIGAKEHEAYQKKASEAMVGGGANAAAGKARNPIDELFMEPVSNYYPGAKSYN